jgi:hypothetical protein
LVKEDWRSRWFLIREEPPELVREEEQPEVFAGRRSRQEPRNKRNSSQPTRKEKRLRDEIRKAKMGFGKPTNKVKGSFISPNQ